MSVLNIFFVQGGRDHYLINWTTVFGIQVLVRYKVNQLTLDQLASLL